MADIRGNFVNPAYASPQQIAALREYAKQLQTEQPVHHWAQGLGNIARALVGGHEARQADVQEQASNREFAKQLMEATASKDPAKLMQVMSHPMAQPIQALLARQLLEWGPEKGVTLPSGLSVRGPTDPWFSQEPGGPPQRFTPPAAPTAPPSVPPTAPVAPPAAPNAETSSVGDIIPGSRTVTGSPDSAFDALGRQYGVPNLAALNKAGIGQAAELEAAKTAAALKGAQTQTAAGQESVSTPIRQRIPEEIKAIQKQLEGETFYSPLTGKAGHVRAQIPGTPAFNLNMKLETVKDLAAQLYADQLRATNPTARIMPTQLEMYRQSLGLDLRDPETLKRSLNDLMKRYGGGTGYTPTPQPAPQSSFGQAQAAESPGGGVKVLRVLPPSSQ